MMKNNRNDMKSDKRRNFRNKLEPVYKAKDAVLHSFREFGIKHRVIKYPVFLALCIFLFSYHLFMNIFIQMRMREKLSRALAYILVFAMLLGTYQIPVVAVSINDLNTEPVITEPIIEAPQVTEPVTSDPVTEPIADVPITESITETPQVIEPIADTPVTEPITETPQVTESVTDAPVTEPITETPPITEPVAEPVTSDPVTEAPATISSSDVSGSDADSLGTQKEAEKDILSKQSDQILGEEVAFKQYHEIDGIRIKVTAAPGVFPQGAVLAIQKIINSTDIGKIEQLVEEVKDEDTAVNVSTEVEQSFTFDISVLDKDGNPIEPDIEKGQVSVVFENVGAAEAEQNSEKELSVFYVEDDYSDIEELDRSIDESKDAAIIEAEHFSIYTVVITKQNVEDIILHYYQASSRADSYFTIYSASQLLTYKKLLDDFYNGTIISTDKFSTILVNSDEANPMDGITGLGQSTDMTIADLNFSAKIMDDITVATWSPIMHFSSEVKFNGNGHTIQLTSASSVTGSADARSLVTNNEGIVSDVTLKWNGLTVVIPRAGEVPEEEYASVTIKVDGQKAEVGEAITGAEALAISADGGQSYITLVRDDDLAVYRTPISNLFPEEQTQPEGEGEGGVFGGYGSGGVPVVEPPTRQDKVFDVFYVYEDENDKLSLVSLSAENNYQIEVNYSSVSYELEGANTFSLKDGVLSEDVMSSVRMNEKEDGSFEGQEDYEAIVVAAEGYEITMLSEKSKVWVNSTQIGCNVAGGYTYTYDAVNDYGVLRIPKEDITGPVKIQIEARSKEDYDKCNVYLHTRGGSILDPQWTETSSYEYKQEIYGHAVVLPERDDVRIIKGSDSIQFAGWYKDVNCTQPVTDNMSSFEKGKVFHYYAKYTIAKVSDHNNKTYYNYSRGTTDVRGWNGSTQIKTTFGDAGLTGYYSVGGVNSAGNAYDYSGTAFRFNTTQNSDAFIPIGGTSVYIAVIYSYGSANDPFTTVTYVLENRGNNRVSNLNIGFGADVQIGSGGNSDSALVERKTDGGATYVCMTADGLEYRTYVSGSAFGVDAVSKCWYGYYSTNNYNGKGWANNVFNNGKDANYTSGDSAMAFAWCGLSIDAGKVVTRTIKLGMGVTADMNILSAKFDAGAGKFPSNNSSILGVESRNKNIKINSTTGVITRDNSYNYAIPTRTGYKFAYWSLTQGNYDDNPAPAKFTGTIDSNTDFYAVWIPQPDKSITNASSVQKVNGSDSLLVPAELGNIVIYNTTPGVDIEKVMQGEIVQNAAGYAAGFSAVIAMEGSDDRYLLPDDIEVLITDADGHVTKLTKGTGYEYTRWNNRKKADLVINRQYINGNVTIKAIGYGLPPVTTTSLSVAVPITNVSYGDKAVFTATAITSKNHLATYQWYVAPYYQITLDGITEWEYQNQNGEMLSNGVYTGSLLFQDGSSSGNVYISGANKSTLRISGLPVNNFTTDSSKTPRKPELSIGGYHVYCVVTSVRNITGQQATAVSATAQVEVSKATYEAPTGLDGSATTYNGSSDGTIMITAETGRPAMAYKKSTESSWLQVTDGMLETGEMTNLTSGTYQFKYPADANHYESAVTQVEVEQGRSILITYKAVGADNESMRTQYKHVQYASNVTAATTSLVPADGTITNPVKTGYTFTSWSSNSLTNVREDTVVYAVYSPSVFTITLDNRGSDVAGQSAIYEKYSNGFFLENTCTNAITSTRKISLPTKEGYDFLGYFTQETGGDLMITQDGCLSANLFPTKYLANTTYYAHWKSKPVTISPLPWVQGADGEPGDTGINIQVTPVTPGAPEDEIDADSAYQITVTKQPGKNANVVFVYADGVLKKTLTNVIFNASNQYTFTLTPSEVGGGVITVGVGYVETVNGDGMEKSADELIEDAENLGNHANYTIVYKDTSSGASGAPFSGVFSETAPSVGIMGVQTVLPSVVKSGYNFTGWYSKVHGTGNVMTAIASNNTESVVTVYAKWIPNKYNLILNKNEGVYATGYTPASQYEHDGAAVLLPTDTQIIRENYTFLGWFDNIDCQGTPITSVDVSRIGVQTFYAGWEILPLHTITLPMPPTDVIGDIYTIASQDGFSTDVFDGREYKFTLTAAPAYSILSVKANGKIIPHVDEVYTIASVTDDQRITVTYKQIVETDDSEIALEDIVATVILSDGSIGYFDDLNKAIEYASENGREVLLQKDIDADEFSETGTIEIPAGRPMTLNLNGHEFNGKILVDASADISITDISEDPATSELEIENRGNLHIEDGVVIEELLNLGIAENDGTVNQLTQQDSESFEKSKLINNGTIVAANLENGYFVQNADNGTAPSGLGGYSTIMNGNEYYVSLQDALDIANESDTDSNIQILNNVDNLNKTLDIGNNNDKEITIDLNGHTIFNGDININGPTTIHNSNGTPSSQNITANITNNDTLTLDENVNVKTLVNKDGASLTVEDGAKISGSLQNEAGGNITNNGNITALTTNNGTLTNEAGGVLNNVNQESGEFVNKGSITTKIDLKGGKYTAQTGATPQAPFGAAVVCDTTPQTYYGTFEDAITDLNNAPESENERTLKLLENIDDLGSNPLIIDTDMPLNIDLNGHDLGTTGETQIIQIGVDGEEGASAPVQITDGRVTPPATSTGSVNTPITIKENGTLSLEEEIISEGNITNEGSLTNNGTINGDLVSSGETDNNGSITGSVTNTGDFTNTGDIANLTQIGGNFSNETGGLVTTITQTGGETSNEGEIGHATVSGGGFKGNEPEGEGTGTIEKAAKITKTDADGNESTIFFASLQDAFNHAQDATQPVTIELLKDVTETALTLNGTNTNEITLDLNGHDVNSTGSLSIGEGMELAIADEDSITKGEITITDVDNSGKLSIDEGITATGDYIGRDGSNLVNDGVLAGKVNIYQGADMTNNGTVGSIVDNQGHIINNGSITGTVHNGIKGSLDNKPSASITGKVTNEGQLDNQGTLSEVEQNNGLFINGAGATTDNLVQNGGDTLNTVAGVGTQPGTITSMKMNEGCFEGTAPLENDEDSKEPVATIGNKKYTDLQQAIDDANHADSDTEIILISDVELPTAQDTVIGNTGGHDITLNLNGNDITGGAIKVETPYNGNLNITDNNTTTKGTISSPVSITEGSDLSIANDITVSGNVTNDGTLVNTGTLTGTLTNNGDVTNNGSIATVVQNEGSLQNSETAAITNLTQNGGSVENEGAITTASVAGGTFDGNDASTMDYNGAEVMVETTVTDGEDHTNIVKQYYQSLAEALENASDGASLTLLKDIEVDTDVIIQNSNINLDLRGHDIGGSGSLSVGDGKENVKITDSIATPEGNVTIPIVNNGELTIDTGVTVEQIGNHGVMDNKGSVTGNVTNFTDGTFTNHGSITNTVTNNGQFTNTPSATVTNVVQEDGTFTNHGQITTSLTQHGGDTNNSSVIQNMLITGGSFAGTNPVVTDEASTPFAATTGGTKYISLSDALDAAKESTVDTEVTLLTDVDLGDTDAVLQNDNDKKITLNLAGHDLSGTGTLQVNGDAKITTGSNEGVLQMNTTIATGGELIIDGNVVLDGEVENSGTITNKGSITDNIHNRTGATLINKGEDSYISGNIQNEGNVENEGAVGGTIENTGELINTGYLDGDVTNKGTGHLTNDGNLSGQLTNKDSATTENSGLIHQLRQEGGTIQTNAGSTVDELTQTAGTINNAGDIGTATVSGTMNNTGTIESATISDIDKFNGSLPETGFDQYIVSVSYTDENGNLIMNYYESLQDACEAAGNLTVPVQIDLLNSIVSVDGDVVIPENAIILIKAGDQILVEDGGTLTNNGAIDNKGTIESDEGGSIVNNGSIDSQNGTMSGTVENNGTITRPRPPVHIDPPNEGITTTIGTSPIVKPNVTIKPISPDISGNDVLDDLNSEPLKKDTDNTKKNENNDTVNINLDYNDLANSNANDTDTIAKVVVKEPVLVTIDKGQVLVSVESLDHEGNESEDALKGVVLTKMDKLIDACFNEDEKEKIKQGDNAELRVVIKRVILSIGQFDGQANAQAGSQSNGQGTGQTVGQSNGQSSNQAAGQTNDQADWDIANAYIDNKYEETERPELAGILDISLEVRLGEGEWEEKHELANDITITFDIPKEVLFADANYYVLRVHDKVVSDLPDLDDNLNTVTIMSDQFSSYILSYDLPTVQDDTNLTTPEENDTNSEKLAEESKESKKELDGTLKKGDHFKLLPILIAGGFFLIVFIAFTIVMKRRDEKDDMEDKEE